MNDLRELRRTLDVHAHDLHDSRLHGRAASVRGRVRAVKRRRAGAVVAATVIGVVTATGVVLLPDGGPEIRPAERTVLGEVAPQSFTTPGWSYEFASAKSSADRARVAADLPFSDRPRLISWMTSGDDQDVRIRVPMSGEGPVVSGVDDFADFMWIPAGYGGVVEIRADEPGLGMAVYEVDESVVPEGVTSDGVTFRKQVGGRLLVEAAVGERGDTDLAFDFTVPGHTVSVAHTCIGFPQGYAVNISLDGSEEGVVIGRCDDTFDPGASPETSFPDGVGVPAGEASTARMWVTKGMNGDPVDPGDFPDARLGLGLYTFDEEPLRLAGAEAPRTVESGGRLWALDFSQQVAGAPTIDRRLPADAGPLLVTAAYETSGGTTLRLLVDGRAQDGLVGSDTGWGALPEIHLPPGTRTVSFEATRGRQHVDHLGLAFYRQIG